MPERFGRMMTAFALLVGLWIAVYWLWQPDGDRIRVSFGNSGPNEGEQVPGAGEPASDVAMPTPSFAFGSEGETAAPAGEAPIPDDFVAPEFREYVVQQGDTLERIASREFGDARHALTIARANPFKDPRRLSPGEMLRLPLDPGNIQGVSSGVLPSSEPAPPPMIEYEVQRGDTLGAIAQRFYGTVRAASRILDANQDQVRSADSIRVGQTLRLPEPDFPAGDGGR